MLYQIMPNGIAIPIPIGILSPCPTNTAQPGEAAKGDGEMQRVLQFLAADYARSRIEYRIENATFRLLPLIVAVPVIAVAVQ